MRSSPIQEAYRALLNELYHHGVWETNARTGVGVTALEGGWSFKLSLLDGRLPIPGNRRYYPRVAAAETAWQLMGTKDPAFIMRHAPKVWGKFVEDRELKTAYGYRWRSHFGRDQLQLAVDELRSNPTNRQLYVSAWDPSSDGLGGPQPKNIPCPVGFSLTRTRDDLHASVFVRSSDVFVGLPYDVMGYTLTLDAMAAEVGCRPSSLHFTLAHPHYYDPHAQDLTHCIRGKHTCWSPPAECQPTLPGWSVSQILADPDGYVATVATLSKRCPGLEWDPLPEVIE